MDGWSPKFRKKHEKTIDGTVDGLGEQWKGSLKETEGGCFTKSSSIMLTVNSRFFLEVFMRLDLTIFAPRGSGGISSSGVRMVVVVGDLTLDLHGSLVHGLISTCYPSRSHNF